MAKASDALLRASLQSAEDALSNAEQLSEVKSRCEDQAVELLALETPVARDLRQVISSIYIVEDFDRMGALAMHVASAARRRHPEHALPDDVVGFFKEMSRLVADMSDKIRDVLIEPNTDIALALSTDDDAVDDLQQHMLRMITLRPWPHSTREAVDIALLARFFERYADHTVNVASRIVYLSTGMRPEEYLQRRADEEIEAQAEKRWQELENQFRRG